MSTTKIFRNLEDDMAKQFSRFAEARARRGDLADPKYQLLFQNTETLDMVASGQDSGVSSYYVILGAGSATPFVAEAAYQQALTHNREFPGSLGQAKFIVLGSRAMTTSSDVFRCFVREQHLKLQSKNVSEEQIYQPKNLREQEKDVAGHTLLSLGVSSNNILQVDSDLSRDIWSNLETLKRFLTGRHDDLSNVQVQIYALAGMGYRALGTAQKVFDLGDQSPVIAVQGAIPGKVPLDEYRGEPAIRMLLVEEGAKSLPTMGADLSHAQRVRDGEMHVPDYQKANAVIIDANDTNQAWRNHVAQNQPVRAR